MCERRNTNDRYKHFTQELFTAGDYEQFVSFLRQHRQSMKKHHGEAFDSETFNNLFTHDRWSWNKYNCGNDLFGTFEYLFHKFKKGIYVQIVDNRLNIFLPFSNVDYRNEFADSLQIDRSKYSCFEDVYKQICLSEKREYFPNRVCRYTDQWYCNNGLVRYEYPLKENDSGINMIHDMLLSLCNHRKIPDCEFFINKRDFPILSLHGHEPYDALVPPGTPLFTHSLPNYLPILGMTTRDDFADIPIPTWEDWSRCAYEHDQRTFGKHFKTFETIPLTDFDSKIPTLVFRGASTGLGTTIENNPRLYFTKLSLSNRMKSDNKTPFLDIGITKWNTRPRKERHDMPLSIPNPDELGIPISNHLTPFEQSQYRYILHLPGHSFAYRLGLELSMASVILLYPSNYNIWYVPLLRPYVHYIPLEKGLDPNEIYEKIQWCDDHLEECKKIAQNARDFYIKYLSFDSTLDYFQRVLQKVSRKFDFSFTYTSMTNTFEKLRKVQLVKHKHQHPLPSYDFEKTDCIKTTKHTKIYVDETFVYKHKDSDMSHSHYISTILQEQVGHICPNFHFSVDISEDKKTLVFPNTKTPFMTLETYLHGNMFHIQQFKLIMNQILWSLKIAQSKCCFMHYDLSPWNVLLFESNGESLTYLHHDKTMTMRHQKYVAKIIDYEYSCVLHDNNIVHNIQPFFLSETHDVITLIYNCFHIILKSQRLAKEDLQWVRILLKYLSKRDFWSVQDMKYYLASERKFSRIILTSEAQSKLQNRPSSIMFRLEKFFQTSSISSRPERNDWFCSTSTQIDRNYVIEFIDNLSSMNIHNMNDIYLFQKVYDFVDKSYGHDFEQDFLDEARRDALIAYHTNLLKSPLRFDDMSYEELDTEDTIVTSPNNQEWSSIRWYPFSQYNSLHLKDVNPSLEHLHHLGYIIQSGYTIESPMKDISNSLKQYFQHMYDNRLWKLSQSLLSSLS